MASADVKIPAVVVEARERKVISRARAMQRLGQLARNMGENPESLPPLEIVYVWFPLDNDVDRDEAKDGSIFRAQWAMHGSDVYVDAHSGRVWRND